MMEVDTRQQDAASEYFKDFWTPLSHTIDAFLHPRTQSSPISFQETFTLVYKSVGEGHSDRLHSDLMTAIKAHLQKLHVELLKCLTDECGNSREQGVIRMVHMFDEVLSDYIRAVRGIAATFSYLGKFLALRQNPKTLEEELTMLFCYEVAEHFIHDILSCVERSPPFTLDPGLLNRLFQNLQFVSHDGYGVLYSKLFARFVTHALPRMREKDLDAHIAEVHELQAQMKREQEHMYLVKQEPTSGRNPALKRRADEGD